ncbi:myomegalin-like isoform X2 [Pelobates cultripes]|uniref:Myomegalin-like isoform X2 n=1 Tax=Pelobates cultripes TaxID=61616 RepID=A0AAD1TKP9_PELCU|nr:myomegalin-like isoform X2 [Pelobates cultripes]
MSNGYRTLSQHLNDLKKENFSLKLRIYFLEERIQQKYEDSSDDVYKRNIELKVEVESLKQELQEKQQYLDKTWATAENLTSYNEAELRRQYDQKREETEQVQELLENKIQLLQEEARLSKNEADRMSALLDAEKRNCMDLRKTMKEFSVEMSEARLLQKNYCSTLAEKDKMIQHLTLVLDSKDSLINQLAAEKQTLVKHEVKSLEQTINDLKNSLQHKDCELQNLIEKQHQDNVLRVSAGEVHVQDLQRKLLETEDTNKILQDSLIQVTADLSSTKELSRNQERIIQTLHETVQSRDNEVAELCRTVEEQNTAIAKLQKMLYTIQREQIQVSQVNPSQLQVLDLQNALFCAQNELQALQHSLRQKDRQVTDAKRSQRLLEADLLAGQRQKETSWKHNQELHGTLHKLQAELQEKNQQLQSLEEEKCRELYNQEHTIQCLNQTLSQKERVLQEYTDLLEYQQGLEKCPGSNEHLLEKLRLRIKERDAALEHAVDAKFCALEEKEKEMQQLKMVARERERDLEQLRRVSFSNEETINSLDNLVKAKDLELEQISVAYKNLQWLKQESEEKHRHSLNERQNIVQQLQSSLQDRNQEVETLTACLLKSSNLGAGELVEELHICLQRKEELLQKALNATTQQADQHLKEIQELLNTIASEKMDQATICRNCKLKDQQVSMMEHSQEHSTELTGAPSTPMAVTSEYDTIKTADKTETLKNDLAKAKDDLHLVLRKEREGQLELSALQSIIQKQMDELQEQAADMDSLSRGLQMKEDLIKDLQMQLVDPEEMSTVERLTQQLLTLKEKMASDENSGDCSYKLTKVLDGFPGAGSSLNQVLQIERQLFSKLIQYHAESDRHSSELQAELQTAQVLRSQLEDSLTKAAERLAQSNSESGASACSFGGLFVDEDGDDASSQFTDSIEDEADACDNFSTAVKQEEKTKSVENIVSEKYLKPEFLQVENEVHHVTEETSKTEEDLHYLKAKLEKTEIFSAAEIRTLIEKVCLEKDNLKVEKASAMLEQCEVENMEESVGGSVIEGLKMEISQLQEKLKQAETVIKHLKVHLELNSPDRDGAFNPDLIVSMAKEIERLKMESSSTTMKRSALAESPGNQMSKRRCSRLSVRPGDLKKASSGQDSVLVAMGDDRPDAGPDNVQGTLEKQALQLKCKLVNTMRQNEELQEKLVATEATVHAQTDQLEQYRLLLDESVVEHDSKQVQVDLQDLGYETCGRSETEIDREETSSPEYDEQDDLFSEASLMEELVSPDKCWSDVATSSPLKTKSCLQNDWTMDWEKSEDIIVLQQHVKDLKAQLRKSQKVIRGLQSRARSYSASSTCASTNHRLKHSVSFEGSPSHGITDEDEHWQPGTVEAHSTKDLDHLLQRVSMLEAQLQQPKSICGVESQIRSTTWPGKYDSLIQAQARELSLLRQKLREGRRVGHILSQHLGDIIKSFEELLRANDIDYYMGQGFREQLAQGRHLAERLYSKLNSKERLETDDKSSHELLAIRLSKELQQKDKIIASLQSKLEVRSVTPSSSRALSDSDLSDRTSLVSDDQLSTNQDLYACSEAATTSEYTQEDHKGLNFNFPPTHLPTTLPTNSQLLPFGGHPSIHDPTVFSIADVQQELHTLQKQLAESMPLSSPVVKSTNTSNCFYDTPTSSTFLSSFPQNLYNGSNPSALQIDSGFKTDTAYPGNSALWDMSHIVRPTNINVHGDTSSGSSGYQSASKLTGSDLLEEHLFEIQNLRKRLEESIHSNDRLREQLEERLRSVTKESGSPTNIYIQGLESLPQLSNENRSLREEKLSLLVRISQITQDYNAELEKLKDLLRVSKAQLRSTEADLEEKKSESTKFQEELEDKKQEILQLQKERLSNQEKNNRLQHQATLLEQQLNENCQLLCTLQAELQVYERLCASSRLMMPDMNCYPSSMEINEDQLEGDAHDGSFASKNGRHVIGHIDDFSALKQQLLDGHILMKKIQALMQSSLNKPFLEIHGTKAREYGSIIKLFSTTNTLQKILEECGSLISMFWRAALPNMPNAAQQKKEEQALKDEICHLRAKLKEQEKGLQETVDRLKSTNRAKESMEHFIVSQLNRTHDVLKKARSNLEVKRNFAVLNSTIFSQE